jgi:hypothetical protein
MRRVADRNVATETRVVELKCDQFKILAYSNHGLLSGGVPAAAERGIKLECSTVDPLDGRCFPRFLKSCRPASGQFQQIENRPSAMGTLDRTPDPKSCARVKQSSASSPEISSFRGEKRGTARFSDLASEIMSVNRKTRCSRGTTLIELEGS